MSKAFTSEETESSTLTGRPVNRAVRGQERPITLAGFRALQSEAERLRARVAAAGVVAEATVESHRLAEIVAALESVRVVEPMAADGVVRFGSRVAVRWSDGSLQTVCLVGPDEADARRGQISIDAPLAKALLGAGLGDPVELVRPGGVLEGEVVGVE